MDLFHVPFDTVIKLSDVIKYLTDKEFYHVHQISLDIFLKASANVRKYQLV